MKNKLSEKLSEIEKAKNKRTDPKKQLIITIISAVCIGAVMAAWCVFTGDRIYLAGCVLAPAVVICYAVYAYFKEKRQDKKAGKDSREFIDGSKYGSREWKTSYSRYREKHSFEDVSSRRMDNDLKRRYRTRGNLGLLALGLFLLGGAVITIAFPVEGSSPVISVCGIIIGGAVAYLGSYYFFAVPVRKFLKSREDLRELEGSYQKGRMLSLGDNGINLGGRYVIIYKKDKVYAVDTGSIQSVTRKMERVKKYEDSLYSGDEYRYYLCVEYNTPEGTASCVNVRLDEFQTEMMMTEFSRKIYTDPGKTGNFSVRTEDDIV